MKRELTPKEVLFNIDLDKNSEEINLKDIPQIAAVNKMIKRAISIKEQNYNLFIVESFSNDKIKELARFIEDIFKDNDSPKDICYVNYSDEFSIEPLFLSNGRGKCLKEAVESIKESYLDAAMDFYNTASDYNKDSIIENINAKRNYYIGELMGIAKKEGFEVKATDGGFAFIPLKSGETMTEKEYDELSDNKKEEIINKVALLKRRAEIVLGKLKEIELSSLSKIKIIYLKYLDLKMSEEKEDLLLNFIIDEEVYDYLEKLFTKIENELINCYSINIEDDEDEIKKIIDKYKIAVLVDNSNYKKPRVIYEEDPTLTNLLGNIEYENNNGNYSTDLSLISAGSILLANEGCLILNLNQLISNNFSYFAVKKTLITGKVKIDANRAYLDILSINSIKPKSIPVDIKVVLLGSFESYDILYNLDEEFRMLFPLKVNKVDSIETDKYTPNAIKELIKSRCIKNNISNISDDAIKELIKYLSRLVENRNKVSIKEEEIDKILILSRNNKKNNSVITKEDIIDIAYEKDQIEQNYLELYKNNKILISIDGERVGVINGLAVIDSGYLKFGKPIRVTCVTCKGEGKIVDVQRESKLSGSIHEKSISIISGLISNIINPYQKIPVDFHLCFEQTYGLVDGDSGSVSEVLCILSALSKIAIKQNIGVTGSVNQFGEVQAIGGVNEKIEGFYNICKLLKKDKDIGVLIPESNKNEIVLNSEVEAAVLNGNFHIYTMENISDAIEVMMIDDAKKVFSLINEEILKY